MKAFRNTLRMLTGYLLLAVCLLCGFSFTALLWLSLLTLALLLGGSSALLGRFRQRRVKSVPPTQSLVPS